MNSPWLSLPTESNYVLRRARVPRCFLRESFSSRTKDDGEDLLSVDLFIQEGRIERITPASESVGATPSVDLAGRMVWPTLVDVHAHLDKGEVISRVKPDGTIPRAAQENFTDYANWSEEDLLLRMRFSLRCAHLQGVAAIRTHLDYRGKDAMVASWDVYRAVVEEWKARVHLQPVGLASVALFSTVEGEQFADLLAERGGIMGGVTDGLQIAPQKIAAEMAPLLDRLFILAGERNLEVDLHVDQVPEAFLLPEVIRSALRTKFTGKILVDHCVSLALQPEAVVQETLALCGEVNLAFVSLPTSMLYLQDRKPGRTPRWRGVTLFHEIRAAGIPIALATDNCRDSWFPYGDHDMVDLYRQSVRIFQLDHPLLESAAAIGPVPAAIMGLPQVGRILTGTDANLILFRARNLNELLSRPQSDRLVIHRGRILTDPLPDYAELDAK